jgi:hypothetical protein
MSTTEEGSVDHDLSTAIFEVLENRATGERWAVRWEHGSLTGSVDVTGEDLPEREKLDRLRYSKPDKTDAHRLRTEGTTWIVLARLTRFMSAVPPQWVLERQKVTRHDTTRPVNKTLIDRAGVRELDF